MATFEYVNKKFAYAILTVAFSIGLLMACYNYYCYTVNTTLIHEHQGKIARVQQNYKNIKIKIKKKNDTKQIHKNDMQSLHHDMTFINSLITRDVFPWDKFLDKLETNTPESITVTDFSLSDNFSKLVLNGNTKSSEDISLFLKRLEKTYLFKNTILSKLNTIIGKHNHPETVTNLHFTITCMLNTDKFFQENMLKNLKKM